MSHWQAPSTSRSDDQIIPWLRERIVALVAALLVQATIGLLGVLPKLPVVPDPLSYNQPASFWAELATIEFITAVIVSLAYGPGVRLGDLPAIAVLVLGLGFVVLPAVAIVLGGIDAAQVAAKYTPAAAASSWLATVIFGTLYFGLPLVVLAAPPPRTRHASTGAPIGASA